MNAMMAAISAEVLICVTKIYNKIKNDIVDVKSASVTNTQYK